MWGSSLYTQSQTVRRRPSVRCNLLPFNDISAPPFFFEVGPNCLWIWYRFVIFPLSCLAAYFSFSFLYLPALPRRPLPTLIVVVRRLMLLHILNRRGDILIFRPKSGCVVCEYFCKYYIRSGKRIMCDIELCELINFGSNEISEDAGLFFCLIRHVICR